MDFSPGEMAMLLSLGDTEIFNHALLMDARFNSTIGAFSFYGLLSQKFREDFPPIRSK